MNTLAYILLCVLLSKPRSGYELKQLITIFWEAHHSQISTTLDKIEQQGYVTVVDKDEQYKKSMLFRHSTKQQLLDCYSLENNN